MKISKKQSPDKEKTHMAWAFRLKVPFFNVNRIRRPILVAFEPDKERLQTQECV